MCSIMIIPTRNIKTSQIGGTMSKITDITIVNSKLLRLNVDAKAGDEIDLDSLNQVDTSVLISRIEQEKDMEYQKHLNHQKELFSLEKQRDIEDAIGNYKNEITILKASLDLRENELKATLSSTYEKQKSELSSKIQVLESRIISLNAMKENEVNLAISKKEAESQASINELNLKIRGFANEKTIAISNAVASLQDEIIKIRQNLESDKIKAKLEQELAVKKTILEVNDQINELRSRLAEKEIVLQNSENNKFKDIEIAVKDKEAELTKTINEQKERIDNLQLTKSLLNVKRLGEELEQWCNQEYQLHSLSGFENCTWEKDNLSVRDEGEYKGTKADYIFKVYAGQERNETNLLTSVACEMKSEDPSSTNKLKNATHFLKLDKDRAKKNCEYALLISELEWELPNDTPIRKVIGYEKMYMVRPQYFVIFLSIVTALGTKYKDILTEYNKEMEQFKDTQDIIDEFEKMKESVLDKSLKYLENELSEIVSNATKINALATKIFDSGHKVIDTYVEQIKNRIENFNITKINKKINKL